MKDIKENPIFKGLPKKLKEVNNFLPIEKELFDIVQSDHKHEKIEDYIMCAWCQQKFRDRQQKILELGFKSYEQYASWKKVMQFINNEINNEKTSKENKSTKSIKETKGRKTKRAGKTS